MEMEEDTEEVRGEEAERKGRNRERARERVKTKKVIEIWGKEMRVIGKKRN
jgi:hypothetical protein